MSSDKASLPTSRTRRVFRWVSNAFWGLVIVAAILFAWPSQWGGPVTIAKVQGHSMEPTLYTGDVAIAIRNYTNNYSDGDIVVYRVQQGNIEGMVVHRIIRRLDDGNYLTQGDNKQMPDPWEVQPDWIFGKVDITIPGIAGWLTILKSPIFLAVIGGGVVIWVLWPRKDELEEDDDGNEGEGDNAEEPEDNETEAPARTEVSRHDEGPEPIGADPSSSKD